MGEVPAEFAVHTAPSISDSERAAPHLRQYDVFIETTTQMLATPKLHERLLLALEAITTNFGHRQAAIAIINERDAELRVRAALGFDVDPSTIRIEMPLDSGAACVRVIHDAQPLWIAMDEDESSRSLFANMQWQEDVLAVPLFGISEISPKTGRENRSRNHYWTFEPGARTAWHSHAHGQTLHVLQGVAWVQSRGTGKVELHAGQTAYCPPGEEHWHGAAPDSFMEHLGMMDNADDPTTSTTWLEHVTDDDYLA